MNAEFPRILEKGFKLGADPQKKEKLCYKSIEDMQ